MSAVHSPRWYRVAALRPSLVAGLRVRRQLVRGQTWMLLNQQGSSRSVRLNPAAYAIAARLDGSASVQSLWEQMLASGQDPATQDEIIELLAQLREAALLQFDAGATSSRSGVPASAAARAHRNTLLAWRIPLGDPSAWLPRLHPLQRLLFTRVGAGAWVLAFAYLLLSALQHGASLVAHASQWMATPRYALLAVVLYVPIKLVHELAHALAVGHGGGSVRKAGVTLMLGLPVPWVDASAASLFASRRLRMLVGAAGMMAELALAAAAMALWLHLGEGWLRDAAFVCLVITGVSTLVFNANPLQRLDGYYIATDALDLPNLATRSRQWWQQTLYRHLLRLPDIEPMPLARGERAWLAAYAPLAWLCALLIAALAVLWLGQVSFALGLACALVLGWQMALKPMVTLMGSLRRAAMTQAAGARRWQRLGLAAGGLALMALLLPLPQHLSVQGVVWPSDDAQLRAEEEGFVVQLYLADGDIARAGQAVLELSNPALQTQLERQQARVDALEAELLQTLPSGAKGRAADTADSGSGIGSGRAGNAQAELARAQGELTHLQQRHAALVVYSQSEGQLLLPQSADLVGSYLRRGQLVAHLRAGQATRVRVALPESDAGELQRSAGNAAQVRLAASAWQVHSARLLQQAAGAVQQLPSAALSQRQGGPVATDPADKNDLRAIQPVLLFDLQLEPDALPEMQTPTRTARLGERAWVRFDAGFAPLGWQLALGLQRLVQRRFNPQF